MFVRNAILMAQPFDTRRLELTGEPVAIAEGVFSFSASDNGVVVYAKNEGGLQGPQQLQWFDRRGNVTRKVGAPAQYGIGLELSPDGRQAAFGMATIGDLDIWVTDLERGVPNRLTSDPSFEHGPLWEPDGSRIVFGTSRDGGVVPNKLYRKSSSGVGTEEMLYTSGPDLGLLSGDLSSDGRYLVFTRTRLGDLIFDILAMPLSGDRKPVTYLHSAFNNIQPQLSPDGKFLAYSTNETGSYQIVVRTFPDPNGDRLPVTANGGMEPRWRGDGRELYYLGLDGKMMAVPIRAGTALQADAPTPLFQTPLSLPVSVPYPIRYDVTADGQRFLMAVPAEIPAPAGVVNTTPIVAIVNWTAALRKN
jgi:dipeptidyl aminopeptidase/acylaminoacyl peptidase